MKATTISGALPWAAWALLGVGCGKATQAETPAAAASSATPTLERVAASPPVRKTLQLYTTQPGRIEAFESAPLYSKLSGYVDQVAVEIGDRVEPGQTLVTLSVPEMHDELAQKEALVAQAQAEIDQAAAAVLAAQSGITTAEAHVRQAAASTLRADAAQQRAKSEHTRLTSLAASGSVTQKLVDEALEQLQAAAAAQQEVAAAIRAAEAEVAQAKAHVQKAEADRNAAQARLRVAQADLQRSRTLLAYAEIKAPFAGVVTERGVDHGHFVQPGGGGAPLLVVAQLDRVRVCVDVPESEAALVDAGAKAGDPAVIRVQSLSGEAYSGVVARTSWALDDANRSLRAEVDLPNPQGVLRPGMYATVQILLAERPAALTLPKAALVHEGEQTLCCCVEGGVIRRRPLRVGLRTPSEVEILEGLPEDSLVVQTRVDSLQEAQPVEILPPTP